MKSILSLATVALLGFSDVVVARSNYPDAALKYREQGPVQYQGCYSSAGSMTFSDTYTWQSQGHCTAQCTKAGKPVQGQTNAQDCYCGDEVPPASAKVDDSKCSMTCSGYKYDMCGGDGFYTVWLDGISDDVPNAVGSGKGSGSSSTPSASSTPKSTPTTSSSPSVVTLEGETVRVTLPPSSSASAGGSKSSGGGGSNKAAIAAGVVVGIVIIAAIAGGVFLFLRNRKRRAIEEEHRRNAAVSSFINGSKSPASSGGASSFTDTRLDPVMANRRMSDGSIADNQDYSRRILKVTNA